jgi:hypothetical protein
MPASAQCLYFHLSMNADDDGFCEHFAIMRMTDSKPDDLRILQSKNYIKIFDELVLLITDWQENNYIRKDRYSKSKYLEIYKEELKEIINSSQAVDHLVYHAGDNRDTQNSIDKNRLDKNRLDKSSINTKELLATWNNLSDKYDKLSSLRAITEKRKKKIRTRIKENSDFIAELKQAINLIEDQEFLRGENDYGWVVSFDWLISNDTNYIKVLEGKYINKKEQDDYQSGGEKFEEFLNKLEEKENEL